MTLAGGCLCGAVRWETSAEPFNATICHCRDCRLSVGAVPVAWFSVRRAALRWTGKSTVFRSSDHGQRRFCPRCGTALAFEDDRFPEEIDLTAATLDEPDLVPPRDHVWTSSAPAWDRIADGLPTYSRGRADAN